MALAGLASTPRFADLSGPAVKAAATALLEYCAEIEPDHRGNITHMIGRPITVPDFAFYHDDKFVGSLDE